MDGRKTLKLTNQNQFQTLVELMQKNEQLARGFYKGVNRNDVKGEWNAIAEQLNSKGPPVRDADGWLKVWADFKFKVKKKVIHNGKEVRATGGGPNQFQILSPLETAVADLLNFKKWLNPTGIPIGISNNQPNINLFDSTNKTPEPASFDFILNSDGDITETVLETDIEIPEHQQEQPSTSEEPPRKKKKHATAFKQDRATLLQKQCTLQEKTLNGINDSLVNIEKNTKDVERYVRKLHKLKEEAATRDKKRLEIEEETLKIYKREVERNAEQRKEENKLRIMDLEIKKKKIEIQERKLALNTQQP